MNKATEPGQIRESLAWCVTCAALLGLAGCQLETGSPGLPVQNAYNGLPAPAIDGLLSAQSPPPQWEKRIPYYGSPTPPPNQAAGEDHLNWWLRTSNRCDERPSDYAKRKMLPLLLQDRWHLCRNLELLPDEPTVHDLIKAEHDRLRAKLPAPQTQPESASDTQPFGDPGISEEAYEVEALQRWLMLHSRYFRQELIELAGSPLTGGKPDKKAPLFEIDSVTIQMHLKEKAALLRLDTTAGLKILQSLAQKEKDPAAAIALFEFSQGRRDLSAMHDSLRPLLIATVEDKQADPELRQNALRVLACDTWTGQDKWIESLFADTTLRAEERRSTLFTPITAILGDSRWLATAIRLVNSKDKAVHDSAVICVMDVIDTIDNKPPPADAVVALLPWVDDPSWCTADHVNRLRLLQSLDQVNVPQCLPAVRRIIEKSAGKGIGWYELQAAVSAAAKYKDAQAVPGIRALLRVGGDSNQREELVSVILDCGGYTLDQQVQAVIGKFEGDCGPEKPTTQTDAKTPWSQPTSEGALLTKQLESIDKPQPEQAAAFLDYIKSTRDDTACDSLAEVLLNWNYPAADKWLIATVQGACANDDRVTADMLLGLARHAESLRKSAPAELRRLRDMGGPKGALGAVLLGDTEACRQLLESDDTPTLLTLLGAARITRISLPAQRVGRLLDRTDDEKLVKAAEDYLRAEASATARAIVQAHYRGTLLVFGGGQYLARPFVKEMTAADDDASDPSRTLFDDRPHPPPDELWAMVWQAAEGNPNTTIVIRRRGEGVELSVSSSQFKIDSTTSDPSEVVSLIKTVSRAFGPAELKKLSDFLASMQADDLPPYEPNACDGMIGTYVHLKPRYGRAVFMNNPQLDPFSVYNKIVKYFLSLAPTDAERQAAAKSGPGPTLGWRMTTQTENARPDDD